MGGDGREGQAGRRHHGGHVSLDLVLAVSDVHGPLGALGDGYASFALELGPDQRAGFEFVFGFGVGGPEFLDGEVVRDGCDFVDNF